MTGPELYALFLELPGAMPRDYWERLSPHSKTAWDRLAKVVEPVAQSAPPIVRWRSRND